ALSRARVAFRRIADDVEGRLVDADFDRAKLLRILQKPRLAGQKVHQSLNPARRLMLIQTELEMHAHHRKIIPAAGEHQIEWTAPGFRRLLEQTKHGLRVAEDIGRSDKASDCAPGAEYGDLGADCG